MAQTAISFQNYSFRYSLRERWTVLDLNVSISENEFVVLTGPSGSGKSTFCYSILGSIPHFYSGEEKGLVNFNQEEIGKTSVSKISEKIGYIPQRIENSFTTPYVISELAFPLEYRGYPRQKIAEIVEVIAKEIDLKSILYRKIENLSEGKTESAIGCALVTNPEIIIADEPTANLDNTNKKMILSILQNLHVEGKTVIVSTHEYKNYEDIASRLIELEEGKITRDIMLSSQKKKKQSGKRISIDENKQHEIKNNIPNDKIIEIENLSFEYPGSLDLTDITLTLNRGEITGIIGDNGSGKTSLIKLMCGLLKPKTGAIRIKDEEIDQIDWKEITKNIGVVFQNPEIQFFEETVKEEISFIVNNLKEDIILIKEISDLLVQSRLTEYESSSPHSLSHGEKRRLAFLTAIYHNPDIIILDEITNGLEEQNKIWLKEQFYELKKKGKTIIIVSHDWEWLADFVDRIAYLDQGRIKSITDRSQLLLISKNNEKDKNE